MSINVTGPLLTKPTKLSGNSATVVFAATSRTTITSIICTENNGGTQTLTLEIYDGTTSWYLRKAVAMTAGTAFIFNEPFIVDNGQSLRVTSSDASGHIDVLVTYIMPVAAASR